MKLNKVVLYGRTLSEYLLFFYLILEQLKKYSKIIDCPPGASRLVAEMSACVKNIKLKVNGCESLFESLEYVKRKGQEDISRVTEKVNLLLVLPLELL